MPSLLLLVLFASSLFPATVVSVPQDSPATAEPILISAPAASLGGPTPAPTSTCGGCFIVAQVAGLVWYSEAFVYNAATAYYNVAVGNTTGRSTSVSIVKNTQAFTFRPGETGTVANLALTPVTYDSTANINGAILTSPTAYNIFTAYVVNSETSVGGSCSTEYGTTISLTTGYSEAIDGSSGQVTLDAAGEQRFISSYLQTSCRGQGAAFTPGAILQITSTTQTVTQTYPAVSRPYTTRLSIAPTSTLYNTDQSGITTRTSVVGTFTAIPEFESTEAAESSTTPESGSESGSKSGSKSGTGSNSKPTTTTFPFASAPLIIIGSSTITPDRNPVNLPFYSATSVGSVSNGVVIVVPTGTGSQAGNYTAIVPYSSDSGSLRRGYFWTSLWAATLSGIGLVMVWL